MFSKKVLSGLMTGIGMFLSACATPVLAQDRESCQSNQDCDFPDYYCAKALGDCLGVGECVPRPDYCPDYVDPVCGCDGQTYTNAECAAHAGVSVAYQGLCCTGDDADGDGIPGTCDNCPNYPNPDQLDSDGDEFGDICEDCPNEPALQEPSEPDGETTCDDGIDNDCDGLTDGPDPDCGAIYNCGDIDGSGGPVDLSDFGLFALCYGYSGPTGGCTAEYFVCSDMDASGCVDLQDFGLFALWYGQVPTRSVPDCEPE